MYCNHSVCRNNADLRNDLLYDVESPESFLDGVSKRTPLTQQNKRLFFLKCQIAKVSICLKAHKQISVIQDFHSQNFRVTGEKLSIRYFNHLIISSVTKSQNPTTSCRLGGLCVYVRTPICPKALPSFSIVLGPAHTEVSGLLPTSLGIYNY